MPLDFRKVRSGALIMKLKKIIATFAAAFVIVLGSASAASAAPYPPEVEGGPTSIAPGGSGTFTFANFDPNESVTFTLTGESASAATLAALAAVDSKSITKAADASGTASVTVTLPANATGTYTLTASAASGTASTTITAALGATGADISPILLWGAVGIVGLGVIALIAVAAVRRSRRTESVDAG